MPKPSVPLRSTFDPFAHIEAQKKAKEDERKKKIKEQKPAAATKAKGKDSGSWMDVPISGMKYVGDYLRGVNR